jgi:hypothetical protein
MIQHIGLLLSLESLVGAAFVVFFAFDRFGKPPTEPGGRPVNCHSRATTTASADYTAVTLYCGVGLAVYGTLPLFPSLLDKLQQLAPSDLADIVPAALRQSPPVVVALLLTVLLPKVPLLAGVDEFFRTRLQHMAAIPPRGASAGGRAQAGLLPAA